MSKIVFPSLILYKVESVRNKDLNLKELQQLLIINCIVVSLFSKTVRQEAWEKESKPFADLCSYYRHSSFSRPYSDSRHSSDSICYSSSLQKGGVPAAPSGTATLLRLSPNHRFHPRPTLAVTDFRRPRLSWLDGRCVQGPGTYSPRHG